MKRPNNTANKQIDITILELKIFGVPDLEPDPEPEFDGADVVGLAVGHVSFFVPSQSYSNVPMTKKNDCNMNMWNYIDHPDVTKPVYLQFNAR